jgi:hypothetical protein
VTTKEDAKTKLAEDSSIMMEKSLQVQPSVENPLLSMQDSVDSPDKGIFHLLDLIGMHCQCKVNLHVHSITFTFHHYVTLQ